MTSAFRPRWKNPSVPTSPSFLCVDNTEPNPTTIDTADSLVRLPQRRVENPAGGPRKTVRPFVSPSSEPLRRKHRFCVSAEQHPTEKHCGRTPLVDVLPALPPDWLIGLSITVQPGNKDHLLLCGNTYFWHKKHNTWNNQNRILSFKLFSF